MSSIIKAAALDGLGAEVGEQLREEISSGRRGEETAGVVASFSLEEVYPIQLWFRLRRSTCVCTLHVGRIGIGSGRGTHGWFRGGLTTRRGVLRGPEPGDPNTGE